MFTPEQWQKILRGLFIAVGGAALTYASTVVLPLFQSSSDPVKLGLAALLSVLINAVHQWMKAQKQDVEIK
jgi:hypothetical protein